MPAGVWSFPFAGYAGSGDCWAPLGAPTAVTELASASSNRPGAAKKASFRCQVFIALQHRKQQPGPETTKSCTFQDLEGVLKTRHLNGCPDPSRRSDSRALHDEHIHQPGGPGSGHALSYGFEVASGCLLFIV